MPTWEEHEKRWDEAAARKLAEIRMRKKPIEELTVDQAKRRIRDELRRMRRVPIEVRRERALRSAAAMGLLCPHCGKWRHDQPDSPLS